MLDRIKELFLNIITSRITVLVVFFLILGTIMLQTVFRLQIVEGQQYLDNFQLRIRKERSIASTRGNIYDRNGNLLAYNELAYSVTIEDVYESGKGKNAALNDTIYRLIKIIEANGDSIINDFNIVLNANGYYEFNVSDSRLLRFLADIYGHTYVQDLSYAEQTATPAEVINYLAGASRYAIGGYSPEDEDHANFLPGYGYTPKELLEMVTIRYAMSANSFTKYIPTVVATDVSERTVAVVMENSDVLDGVAIAEDTIRKYVDSVYFSQIIGYTGKVSTEELTELQEEDDSYTQTDIVGKAGIEQTLETTLQGKKGSEIVYVDNLGKVIETSDRKEPVAGQDVYLTIDKDLQEAVYHILEQKLAGILLAKISNIKEYTPRENASRSDIVIPIYDVYYALINNSVIDISHFSSPDAGEAETAVHETYLEKKEKVLQKLREELTQTHTPYNKLNQEYQVYESFLVSSILYKQNIIPESAINTNDATYIAWTKDETISLSEYINYCIAQNWVDVSKPDLSSQYLDSSEIYSKIVDTILNNLETNTDFDKKTFKYMIKSDMISGKQICKILLEQQLIEIDETEESQFLAGKISSYNFMLNRIRDLDITPAQLALDPYAASVVITDVNTGEVRALVSYPSYDNNKMANGVDAEYYARLNSDLSSPLLNYATQQRTAPGSTFKMVSATAGLEEGVITTSSSIRCNGIFENITPSPRCWIYPRGTHGSLNVSGGIENSCNVFFYEVGYRLGQNGEKYDSDTGLAKLAKYADLYGLSEKSGVEIEEYQPKISDFDAVRSAIGQGTHNYTTVGLARYVTAVANSGTCFQLTLLDHVSDRNGNTIKDYQAEVRNTITLPDSTWKSIHSGMRKVVQNKAYFSDLPISVAGKTGTAQESASRANHAIFVGYAPYENPEIAIATRVAFGYSSDYAAQISRDVIKYYFHVEDEETMVTGTADAVSGGSTNTD